MQARQEAATRVLKVLMAAALLLPLLLFVYSSWRVYGDINKAADERIDRSLEVLHEHALNAFHSVEFAISTLEDVMEGMSDEEIKKNEEKLHGRLKKIDQASETVESLWVVDRAGLALVSSYGFPLPKPFSLADRDYFQAHLKQNMRAYVGEVLVPRLRTGSPFFSISRRRKSPTGIFNGIIEASVSPEDFQKFYSNISRNVESYYALVRADGAFLARYPVRDGRLGENAALRQQIVSSPETGKYTVVAQLDGIERRIGYRKLADYPVYVLAGVRTSAIHEEWLSTMASHLIFGLPATALLFGITALALQRTRRLYDEAKRREMAEDALRQAQKMEAIGQLTGGVAHDFNNLLTVIIGNLDIAQRQLKSSAADAGAKLETFMKNAMQGARRASALTQRLLAFSRRQPLDPKPLKADKLVRGIEDLMRQSLGETIEIEIVGSGSLWQIEADPIQLESAILNLALNARDAMPNGGKLTVETSNAFLDENYVRQNSDTPAGQYVQIAVSDTGTGMSPETIKRAFEPFFTTKVAGQGTGLGLSQVYGFAKQSGGHVKIYSELGEGTTVKIYMPRLFAETKDEVETEAVPASDGSSETILVVEDDTDVREYIVEILRELRYRVLDAGDAQSAMKSLVREGGAVDLILTDVVLPGQNGRLFADEATARYSKLKVLFMTGYSRNAIVHHGRLDPGVEMIQKPLSQSVLAAKIREILDRAPRRS